MLFNKYKRKIRNMLVSERDSRFNIWTYISQRKYCAKKRKGQIACQSSFVLFC